MKKAIKFFIVLALLITSVSLPKTFSQKMAFCDSLDNNKIVGQSNVFNIDDRSRVVTILVYNGDMPFTTGKVVLKFFEVTNDTVETYVTRLINEVPPNSRSYWRKLPFATPGHYNIKAFTYEGKVIAQENLTITAYKKPTGNAGFAAVLNEIIKFYPDEFKNITGEKIGNDIMWRKWVSTENLPGYELAFINSEGIERKYWETTLIETTDSVEALNKYSEISKIIDPLKFDCCVFKKEEEFDYNKPKVPNNKTTTWFPASVNTGKDKEYSEMPLQLRFSYPFLSAKAYTVKLNIGFESAVDKLLYAVKHTKIGN